MAYEKLKEEIVIAIKDLVDQGYSQRQVASELGVSPSTVSKYAPIKPQRKAAISKLDIESLCQTLAPMIKEQLENKPEKEAKEEKPMSEEEVAAKVRREIERDSDLKKLTDDVAEIKKGQEAFKSFCDRFPELCQVQERIEKKLVEIGNSKPKGVLGTDLKLNELLKDEKSQKMLAERYLGQVGLLRALELCTGPDCDKIRQIAKEKGIKLQKKAQGGMIGPDWDDVE